MSETQKAPFDPNKHLRQLRGRGGDADYLDVKWRLVWLRSEHPNAHISTEKIAGGMESNYAEFRAQVVIPDGGSATGYGSESKTDFNDFIEKAETKAVGRALAALGYGTQFAPELDEGDRIADSPVERAPKPPRMAAQRPAEPRNAPARPAEQIAQHDAAGNQRATERQVKFCRAIAAEAGLDAHELETWSLELYQAGVDQLNRRDMSTLIEALQRRRNEIA